ncbi:hypothetical protein TWF696_008226 [Orbilia brochopaga]|uniref:Uncharacterized protein n=1 Tax=Orbilia brochopaga TaxID=3140254 RepID=A0AAV9UFR3_9PEZI
MTTLNAPFSLPSCNGISDLLHPQSSVREGFISRIQARTKSGKNGSKKARQERNALYQSKLSAMDLKSKVGQNTYNAIQANPTLKGLPRFFGVKLAGADSLQHGSTKPSDDAWQTEGHTMFFSALGVPGKPVKFNDGWISADDVNLSPDGSVYNIDTTDADNRKLGFYLDFADPQAPTGSLTTPQGIYHLSLQPFAVQFDVSVSLNAGAYYSSGTQQLKWDETSDTWKNATWNAKSMVFSYDTVTIPDPFKKTLVNEVSFQDPEDPDHPFELTKDDFPTKYTTVADGTIGDGVVYMTINVAAADDVPQPTSARATQAVQSVYPIMATFKFDDFGDSFTGAYMVPNSTTVYAVTGVGIINYAAGNPDEIQRPMMATAQSNANGIQNLNLAAIPGVVNGTSAGAAAGDTPRPKPSFATSIEPAKNGFHLQQLDVAPASSSNLIVNGLLGLNPMLPSPAGSSSPYYDAVAQVANQDFNDILCYYMDDDIRTTFVQAGPYNISDPKVQQIATDSNMNEAFYKQLQVPYVTTSLSGATNVPESAYCNGLRAQKQLQDLPANSPIYKRHTDALYRHRFKLRFSIIKQYLEDQKQTDYTAQMQGAAGVMKEELASRAKGISDPNALKAAQDDIDGLLKWATDNKLYWAFNLYYWCEHFFIPTLYAQSVNGLQSSTISMKLKSLSTTFGMLEGTQNNPNGKTFQQAFNELLRVFQMSTIIPQLVDLEGFSEDFDSILKSMLQEFYDENVNNPNPDIAKQAALAKQLLADDNARQGFYNNIIATMRVASTLASWAYIVKVFGDFNETQGWWKKLVNAGELASTFMMFTCGIMLVVCSLGPSWKTMTPAQRTNFVTTAVLVVLVLATKLATTNGLARWFLRTREDAMAMQGEDLTVWTKMFGRNAGEFLANCVGAVLAGVCLVLSATDVANATDPLQKAMDSMMIISSSLQLLAIAASWIVSAGFVTAEATVAIVTTVASWLGPAALAFAVIGIIIMIVWQCLHKDPPNPVQDFIDKHAAPAGLKMPYQTEIDYMNAVPEDPNSISLNGIDFGARINSGSPTVGFLQLGPSGSVTPPTWTLGTSTDVTYLPDTCWSVKTDSAGISRVSTYITTEQQLLQTIYLTVLDDGMVGFAPPPAKETTDSSGKVTPVDPQVYGQQLKQQQWSIVCQAEGTKITRMLNGKSQTFTKSAYFSIRNGTNQLYLQTTETGGYQIVLGIPPQGFFGTPLVGTYPGWQLSMDSIGPPPLSYSKNPWTLSTTQTDESNTPMFNGPTSSPITWSITPALPSWLQLVGSGDNQGVVMQVAGVQAPVTPATEYTVTASIVIAGKRMSQSTAFTVSVIAPPAPAPPS